MSRVTCHENWTRVQDRLRWQRTIDSVLSKLCFPLSSDRMPRGDEMLWARISERFQRLITSLITDWGDFLCKAARRG
jgi:hypothetical protein